jgi:phage terminase large subunit-like protein
MADFSCAVPDWRERIAACRSLIPDLPLFEPNASRAVEIFNSLHLPDVPGRPLLRDAAGEWQRDLVRAIFGSFDDKENKREIREFFCMVPKKSSKTTGGAAIMLTALLMNRPLALISWSFQTQRHGPHQVARLGRSVTPSFTTPRRPMPR